MTSPKGLAAQGSFSDGQKRSRGHIQPRRVIVTVGGGRTVLLFPVLNYCSWGQLTVENTIDCGEERVVCLHVMYAVKATAQHGGKLDSQYNISSRAMFVYVFERVLRFL